LIHLPKHDPTSLAGSPGARAAKFPRQSRQCRGSTDSAAMPIGSCRLFLSDLPSQDLESHHFSTPANGRANAPDWQSRLPVRAPKRWRGRSYWSVGRGRPLRAQGYNRHRPGPLSSDIYRTRHVDRTRRVVFCPPLVHPVGGYKCFQFPSVSGRPEV
jgi:hypothetical protein